MPQKTIILGSGGMATAIALLLAEHPGQEVTLWCRSEETAQNLNRVRINEKHLPGISIPDQIEITYRLSEDARRADFLVAAIPSQYLRPMLALCARELTGNQPVISVIKGVENGTLLRPSEILRELLGPREVISLTGPSHAEEIARKLPASVVAACPDLTLAREVQQILTTDRFRVYTNPDLIGAEFAGALKNIIGIAAGISDGLGYGDNAKSALMTRGIVEITRFGVALGADAETFAGLAGIGDLITTCTSRHGRNRMVGERLGRGESLAEILGSMNSIAEGVSTARSIHELALQKKIEMPITEQVYSVLFEGISPQVATDRLMNRPAKDE